MQATGSGWDLELCVDPPPKHWLEEYVDERADHRIAHSFISAREGGQILDRHRDETGLRWNCEWKVL